MKSILIIIVLILITGCADKVNIGLDGYELRGFWAGLWHGIICPFSFFISLFFEDTVIYAVNNNGGFYDFGFVIGAGILFGGSSKVKR